MLAGATTANGYRQLHADAAGVWTYTLDNSNATVQALNAGQTLTDTLHRDHGRRHPQVVTITINGTQRRRGDQRPRQRGLSPRPAASPTARRAPRPRPAI